MGDKNLIQLKTKGEWHYWNYGDMMPICGAGERSLADPKHPNDFVRSSHRGYARPRKICAKCQELEGLQSAQALDEELQDTWTTIVTELNENCHMPDAMDLLKKLYEKGIKEGLARAKDK